VKKLGAKFPSIALGCCIVRISRLDLFSGIIELEASYSSRPKKAGKREEKKKKEKKLKNPKR